MSCAGKRCGGELRCQVLETRSGGSTLTSRVRGCVPRFVGCEKRSLVIVDHHETSFGAMAQPLACAARARLLCMSCLLLGCLMSLGQIHCQRPFIQASMPAQRSTGTFCSHFAAGLRGPQPMWDAELPVRGSRLLWLPCLALLGTVTHRRGVPCFVRERLRGSTVPAKWQGGGKSKGSKGDAPRVLTSTIKKAETAAELLGVLDGVVESSIFNHIHASAACTSLAAFNGKGKLQAADAKSPVIQRLGSRIEGLIQANEVDPRALANVLWAFAKMFVAAPAVLIAMPALVRAVAAKATGMNAQELANSIWAAAQLHDACAEVLDVVPALVAQIPSKAGDMKPQELSNTVLSAAKLHDVAPVVREALPPVATEIPGRASGMKPQELSNCLWAAAKLKDAVPEVLDIVPALVEEIPDKAGKMKPQELSNILWAAANMHDEDSGVLEVVGVVVQQVMRKPGDMNPQDLANNLWAAARLQDVAPEVLSIASALVAQIPGKAGDMIPQHLSNSLWATAKLQDAAPEVIGSVPALVAQIPGKAGGMNPQELSNVLWAAAQLQDTAPEVLQVVPTVAAEIPAKVDNVKPQHLSNCLFSAMLLADAVPEVLEAVPALVKEVPGKVDAMKPQELANGLEAVVVLAERLPIVGLPRIAAAAAMRLKRILPEVKGKDFAFSVPVIVWACGKAEVLDMETELLTEVAKRFASRKSITTLTPWSLCALACAYRNLDDGGAFANLLDRLESEISKRGLREEEVLRQRR